MSASGQYQTAVVYGGQIYISIDFGNTWAANGLSLNWVSVSMSASGQYQTAVHNGGLIYISIDFGNTWASKPYSRWWYSVSMSASGQYQTAVVHNGQIYISIDFGNTWVAKASSLLWLSVSMSASGQYQTAVPYGGQIYISADFGNTWAAKASSLNWKSVAVSASGQYQTAVVENGQIYISDDFGNTWVAKASSLNWRSVSMSASGQYQAAVVSGDFIYISADFGNTWVAKTSTSLSWISVSMSASGQYLTAVVSGGLIYVCVSSYATSISDSNINAVCYPTFVSSVGMNNNLLADTITGPLSYNPYNCELSLGATAAALVVGTSTGTLRLGGVSGGNIVNNSGSITITPPTGATGLNGLSCESAMFGRNDIGANTFNGTLSYTRHPIGWTIFVSKTFSPTTATVHDIILEGNAVTTEFNSLSNGVWSISVNFNNLKNLGNMGYFTGFYGTPTGATAINGGTSDTIPNTFNSANVLQLVATSGLANCGMSYPTLMIRTTGNGTTQISIRLYCQFTVQPMLTFNISATKIA
jgi:hypothetical protein